MSTKKKNNKAGSLIKMNPRKLKITIIIIVVLALSFLGFTVYKIFFDNGSYNLMESELTATQPNIDVRLLPVNPYSRPGRAVEKVNGVVVHYTANAGTSAADNYKYFEGLKDSHETRASSNFIIGLDGEIIQCIPTWEMAYASNNRNDDTVSIECCHPDNTGKFTRKTYKSLVQLTAWLCKEKFSLTKESLLRHYDITGKVCPKYFVENKDAWQQFREDVGKAINKQ